MEISRRGFLGGITAAGTLAAVGAGSRAAKPVPTRDLNVLQKEIDQVKSRDFSAYLKSGDCGGFAALARLDAVVDKLLAEIKQTKVTDTPAVWLVYNMGTIVKTKECCFSIDLAHVRGKEFAPLLDFAMITHNHGDHYTEDFYKAMNGKGKTVISNFKDNYAVSDWKTKGGYTRGEKTFTIKDVEIRTALSDHNEYLVDFTTAFDITVGGRYRIYHSGDSANVSKLNPAPKPDLWIVHPKCGLHVEDGVNKFHPALTAITHLVELGHDEWRWSYRQGYAEAKKAEAAGSRTIVPLWGDRII